MKEHELKTLKAALNILKNRLNENVTSIKQTTRSNGAYVFNEESFQNNKLLLKENQENLMLQKNFSDFMSKYLVSALTELTDNDEAIVEQQPVEAFETIVPDQEEMSQEDYFIAIVEGEYELENTIHKINDGEILKKLMNLFLADEHYEACSLIQNQINTLKQLVP